MSEYKPITIDDIRAVMDHLSKEIIPPPETIYLTQEEWNSLCEYKPIELNGQVFPARAHKVVIVTAEERETILKLKHLSDEKA